MSRLEVAARPVLVPLIDLTRALKSLSPAEAETVGKWAVKTAYMVSWTSPLNSPVDLAHLNSLNGDDGKPADGVAVFGMQADYRKPTSYVQTGHWPQFGTMEAAPTVETPESAYKIALQVRHLYLLIAFWPNPTSEFTLVSDQHVPLHPATQAQWPNYSPDLTIGDGPIDRLAVFANWLAVRHH